MKTLSTDILICGAGICGIATAYQLATKYNITDVLLVDPEPPLSVTSDKSFEGYRNWWPGPGDAMVALSNHSLDILEEIHRQQPALLHMNRGGYLFVSADASRTDEFIAMAEESCGLGAGELRIHRGSPEDPPYLPASSHALEDAPDGADLILDQTLIRTHFPYLAEDVSIILHARRCGWFAARQFGMYMLDEARERGVQFLAGKVMGIETDDGAITGVRVQTAQGETVVQTSKFVNAAGPGQKEVGQLLGVELTIWTDPYRLEWTDEEREFLAEDAASQWLLEEQPPIIAARPEGGGESNIVLMLAHYRLQPEEPVFPLPMDPAYPEFVLRGLSRMIPGMQAYFENLPKPYVDGGYYVGTVENRPILGPMGDVEGAYIIGAISGVGMQLAPACGELLADYLAGAPMPDYAQAFLLQRFDDPDYLKLMAEWGATGSI